MNNDPSGRCSFPCYELRLRIAKDGNRSDANYLADFEKLVENIRDIKSDYIGITSLCGSKFSYLAFYEPESQLILGILRAVASLTDHEDLATEHIARGLSSGMEKYSKTKFIRDWKSHT